MATKRIRFRPARLWLMFVPIALLAVVSFLIQPEAWRSAERWVYAVFAGALVFLVAGHFLLQRYYYLELTDAGLRVATLGGQRFYRWEQIEGIDFAEREIDTAARGTVLLLRLREASKVRRLVGGDVSILAVYEKSPEEIVAMIRERLC
jgi:Bacterial PH domain